MRHSKYILLLSVVYLLQSHLPIDFQISHLESLSKYEVIEINDLIPQQKKSLQQYQTLDLGKYGNYTLDIYENQLLSDQYSVKRSTNDGILEKSRTTAKTYIGKIKGNPQSSVALTFNDNFLHGFIKHDDKEINIEPLRYYQLNAGEEDIVVYESGDQEHKHTVHCGLDHKLEQEFKASVEQQKVAKSVLDGCIEVDMAIASDYLMYEHYGNTTNVENHAIAMLNAAQTNYDTEFADEIRFNLIEQFISECPTCDPWTSSTDTETLLTDFREWADYTWGNVIDQSSLWSKRDFERDGNTSANGLAFVNTICTSHSSLVVEDNDTANRKRVLFAHELGHNFGAVHDDVNTNFIMSTPLIATNEWSTASKEDINNRYLRFPCLTSCERSQNVVADFNVEFIGACVPVNVQFRNTSFGDLDSVKWIFPGGNPTFSTEFEPIVNYGVGGTFDVRLEIYGTNGTIDILERSDVISFGQNPSAEFSYEISNDTTVTFSVDKPLDNTTYSWDFGDGLTSAEQNPVHIYDKVDSTTATLIVSNNCGTATFTTTLSKDNQLPPQADFASTDRFGCVGEVMQFINLSENADSLSWFFEGGTPFNTSDDNPEVVFENAGSFTVGLIAINEAGADSILASAYAIIDPIPVSGFTFQKDAKTVSFTQTSEYARALLWDFGDGNTSEDIHPSHTYAEAGNYTVSLLVENICDVSTSSQTIEIQNEIPIPDFTTSSIELCEKGSVLFNNTSTNAISYEWEFEGGSPSSTTEESPIVAYLTPGTFSVKLIATNKDGSAEIIKDDLITIFPEPIIDFDFSVDGETVEFINNSQHLQSAQWSFGDGMSSTTNNAMHSYSQSGTYEVSLVGANNCGFGTVTKSVTIDIEVPFATFGANTNELCAGSVVGFASSSRNASSVRWIFEGGIPATSTSERPNILYIEKGDYDVTLIATNQNGSDTLFFEDYVTVTSLPSAAFELDQNGTSVRFDNQSSDGEEYFWNLGDGSFSTEVNPSHSYASSGDYSVLLRVSNGCGSNEIISTVTVLDTMTSEAIDTMTNEGLDNNLEIELDFSISASEVCRGSEIVITNLSGEVDSIKWYLNEDIEIQEGALRLTQAGINTISALAFKGDKTSSLEKEIRVIGVPEPDFSFLRIGDTNEIQFQNLSNQADSYIWSFGDRFSSAFENPSHLYEQDIEYTVTLNASNLCSSAVSQKVVDLSIKEKPDALFSVSSPTVCLGESVNFMALDTLATDYKWVFEGATVSDSDVSTVTVNYDVIGSFGVLFIASNLNGSDTTYLENFMRVSDAPDLEFKYQQDGGIVNFQATEIIGATYTWDFGDGSSSNEIRPSHTYSATGGDFEVALTVDLSCGPITISERIQVESNIILPEGSFSITNSRVNVGGRIRFSSLSKNTDQVEWFFEGGSPTTSTEESIIIQYDEPGVFDVMLVAINESGVDTVYKEDFITVEALGLETAETRELVNAAEQLVLLSVYPNPFVDEMNVAIEAADLSTGEFYLLNSAGMLMHNESFTVSGNRSTLRVNVPDLSSGVYIARIIVGEQLIQQKIIKL